MSSARWRAIKKNGSHETTPARTVTLIANQGLAVRYEELRQQVLTGIASGHGHALLLRQGMRAWIETWSRCAPRESSQTVERRPANGNLPVPVQAEIVALLATLVLGARGYGQA